MDIHDYLGVLRRGWALLVIGVLVGIAGGFAAQAMQVPSYSATSRDLITNDTTSDLGDSLQASNLAQSRIASYVQVVTSGLVLQPVIDQLGLNTSVDELASRMSVTSPPNTLVIEITATAATPSLAQRIANAASRIFSSAVADEIESGVLSTPAPTASPAAGAPIVTKKTIPVKVVNIEQAALPTAANASYGSIFLVVGGLVGLAAGLVLASLRESLDRRVRSRKDVAAATELPVIGQVRPDRSIRSMPLVVNLNPGGATAESFRALRANIEHIRLRDGRRTFVIAAMGSRQGSSTIAANLALAIANTETSVVVVDASIQSRSLSQVFASGGARGLTDVLTREADLDSVLRQGSIGDLWLLPAGTKSLDNGALLATQAMRELLAELEDRYDVVLIDAPPIGPVTDAAVLGAFGGATVLVVAEGVATRPALAEALVTLVAGGSTPVGIVLNRIPRLFKGRRAASHKRSLRSLRSLPSLGELAAIRSNHQPKAAKVEKAAKVKAVKPARPARPSKTRIADAPRTVLEAPAPAPSRWAPEYSQPAPARVVPSPELRAAAADALPLLPAPAPALDVPNTAEPADPSGYDLTDPEDTADPNVPAPVVSPVVAATPAASPTGAIPVVRTPTGPVAVPSMEALAGLPSVNLLGDTDEPEAEEDEPGAEVEILRPRLVTVGGYSNVTPITPAISKERRARENYLLKSRELERAARERLAIERRRLELGIRDQLDHEKRELGLVLDGELEDTVIITRTAE